MDKTEKTKRVNNLLQYLYTIYPAVAELLIWIPWHINEEEDAKIAYATRKEIFLCKKFFEMAAKEQLWVLLHEMWHVALRHVDRARRANANIFLANLAMDVLINQTLHEVSRREAGWLAPPEGLIDLAWLENQLGRLPKDWTQYDWYELYCYLLEHLPQAGEKDEGVVLVDGSYFGDPAGPPRRLKVEGAIPDLEEQDGDKEAGNDLVEEEFWASRIKSALAASGSSSMIRRFLSLLPKPKPISWLSLYKRYLHQWHTRYERQVSYARPHRRTLTGIVDYVLPSCRESHGLPPVAVIFDTSGSVPDEILTKFVYHTEQFRQTFDQELEMHVVMVDDRVQEVLRVEPHKTLSWYIRKGKLKLKGGGGTSFAPGLQKATKLGAKLCIYFTDLISDEFGEPAKGMDVLWVTTNPSLNPPFGRCVRILEEEE